MSKKALDTKILKRIEAITLKSQEVSVGKASRDMMESSLVRQMLVIKDRALATIQKGLEAATDTKLSPGSGSRYRKELKQFLISEHKPLPNSALRLDFINLMKRNNLILGKNVIYLGITFKSIKLKIHRFNEKFVEENPKIFNENTFSREKFGSTVNLDHGAVNAPQAALGAGSIAMQEASKHLDQKTLINTTKYHFDTFLDDNFQDLTQKEIDGLRSTGRKLIADWRNIITPTGKLVAKLSILVEPIDKKLNDEQSKIESRFVNALLNSVRETLVEINVLDLEGSSTPRNKIAKKIVKDTIADKLKGKNKKVKIDPKIKSAGSKTRTKATRKTKEVVKKLPAKSRNMPARDPTTGRFIKQSQVNIIALLNSKLPEIVAKNMGLPGLVYRTGRFASSVKAVRSAKTAKGHTSIEYTYQRDPYQVFEMGLGRSPWATPERDPKPLIERSIREIAASFMTERFYVRRI